MLIISSLWKKADFFPSEQIVVTLVSVSVCYGVVHDKSQAKQLIYLI